MALNGQIDTLVTEIKQFASNQGISNQRAFETAVVRLCKAWAEDQVMLEIDTVFVAMSKLSGRYSKLVDAFNGAEKTVLNNHAAELTSSLTNVPE